jgi:hypothetical protein
LEEISEDGSTIRTTIAKRERPHLLFDDDDGTIIVALATGICYGDNSIGLCVITILGQDDTMTKPLLMSSLLQETRTPTIICP